MTNEKIHTIEFRGTVRVRESDMIACINMIEEVFDMFGAVPEDMHKSRPGTFSIMTHHDTDCE